MTTNLPPVALLVLALPWAAVAQDGGAPGRPVVENPRANDQPKPVPGKPVVKTERGAGLTVNPPVNPMQIRLLGDPDSIMLEAPVDPVNARVEVPAPGLRRFDLQNSPIAGETFDLWLFGRGSDEAARRRKLDILLGALVENAAWHQGINEPDRAKLRLAGQGDVKRLFDRVEAERLRFEEVRMEFARGREVLQRVVPLSAELGRGPFGDGSLFAKALAKLEKESADQKATSK